MSTSSAPGAPASAPARGPRIGGPRANRPRSGRAGRIVALVVACVIALAVAVTWILPSMLDWNRYRASVAALVAAGIGRPVEIDGDITLHLLPQPILTASSLKVNDAGGGVVMAAHELRLRVALGPLLGGRVDARELTLRGADLRLPWPPPAGALGRRPPSWLTGLQARVEESRLQVGDLVLSDIDATLGSDPDTGTLSAAGSAKIFGLVWRFTSRLGRPAHDGAAPLDVSLDGQGRLRDTGGTFSGTLADDGGLSGRVAARGPDLSQVMPAPAVPWRGDGRLSAAAGLAVADELALEIGGSPARGAVALRVQPDLRLDLALSAGRLDLDAWAPVLLRAAQTATASIMTTGIDLSAEAATLSGGTIRQLRSAFDVDAGGVTVRELAGLLPGEAKVSLQGRFPRGKPGAVAGTMFEGTAGLIAPDLHVTLRWLEPFAPALLQPIPVGALRTANLTAKLAIDPAQLSFTEIKGTLDGAAAEGGLAVRLGPRLGISAGLSLERLLLDPFLPDPGTLRAPDEIYAALNRTLATAAFDADVKVQLRKAAWRGAEFGPVSIDAQTEAGRLTLRRLEATALGIHATASGTVGEGGRVSEGRFELATQDVSPLRAFLPDGLLGTPAVLRGPASVLIQLAGLPEALAARATIELNDMRAEMQPVINVPARRWSGPVMLHHPGAPRLLEQLGVSGTASWLGDGSFSLIAQATKLPERLTLNGIELIAGALRAEGQLALSGRALTGKLHADTLPLPLPFASSTDPLPLGWLRDAQASVHLDAGEVLFGLAPAMRDLAADLSAANGSAAARNVTAAVSAGVISGDVQLNTVEKPSLSVHGRAQDVAVTAPLFGGTLDVASGIMQLSVDLTAEGYSPAALTATLSGRGTADVRGATVTGFDLAAAQAALAASTGPQMTAGLRSALESGGTSLADLQVPFEIRRGVLTFRASGATDSGATAVAGTLDLLGGTLDGRLTLSPGAGLPEVAARLTGPATSPARTPELAGVARWLAERP